MQRALFAAVSGLTNHQTAMDVIGNNIANVNTVGFKSSSVNFEESFSQLLQGAELPTDTQGGSNPSQVGLGMEVGSIDENFTQGNLQQSDNVTDMAIQGNSFFVVKQGQQTEYTRAGNFQPDAEGRLISPTNGYVLQGRMATNGVLGSALTDIVIPTGMTTPAKATDQITMSGNFDASASTINAADVNNPTDAELNDPANAGSVTRTTKDVYDSLGQAHSVTIVAWKASPTTWDFKIDPSELNYDNTKSYSFGPGAASSPAGATAPWQFTFNSDGSINSAASNVPSITFTPAGGTAAPVSITLDPGSGSTGLTSFVGDTSALMRDQDGYAAGTLTDYTIDASGTVTGEFSNGTTQTIAQIALADFNNPAGLTSVGGNMFTVSSNSGTPLVGYSGRETSSTIQSKALEMSNVDLAKEFTQMIITQRGYEANGKMITTSDDMLETLVNLRR